MAIEVKRRLTYLTLARREWEEVTIALGNLPTVADSCRATLAALHARLVLAESGPDELVTISQPPLAWSPFVMALSVHVLTQPDLLPLAERLRDQMAAQTRRIEGRVPEEHSAGLRSWPLAPSHQRLGVTSN